MRKGQVEAGQRPHRASVLDNFGRWSMCRSSTKRRTGLGDLSLLQLDDHERHGARRKP